MRIYALVLMTITLGSLCPPSQAQEGFLQKEGKFLYPPNLSSRSDNLLTGMTINSVPGFPLTATIEAENTGTDAQGKNVVVRFRSKVYRDSKGRTRHEWDMTPLDEPPKPGWFSIDIYDPTTRTSIHLQPSEKTGYKFHFPAPGEKFKSCMIPDSTIPDLEGSERVRIPQVIQKELAHDVMDGRKVRHGREFVRIPANFFGKSPGYTTLTDYWFSQELQYYVLVKRTGPGKTQHIIKLSGIRHDEPDPSLFVIPADYRMSEPKPGDSDCTPKCRDWCG